MGKRLSGPAQSGGDNFRASRPLGGDEESFRDLFTRYQHPVFSFFARRGLSVDESRDLTQETFMRVFRSIDSFRGEASFQTWLFSIATNLWRNELRHRMAEKRAAAEIPLEDATRAEKAAAEAESAEGAEAEDPAEDLALVSRPPKELDDILAQERTTLLRQALDELPPQMRKCVMLRIGQDLKYREIASVMQISIDTVKSQLGQAKVRLRARLSVVESEFGEAIKALLVESQRHLRGHCTLEELETYHHGALPAERHDDVTEHLAVCEDCTVLLLYAVAGPSGSSNRIEPLDPEVEAIWDQLRPHLKSRRPQGRSLASLLQERRLPAGEALPLALEISRALMLLHSEGRILTDLRTENVLISPAGQVRLLERGWAPETLDFGSGQSAEAAMIDLYRALSPEQVAGEEPSKEANLFSLGVLLFELLTGVSPFRGDTPLSTASRILSLAPAPAREINPEIEPALSDLLDRLLAKEPQERPASSAVVVREIESVLGQGSAESSSWSDVEEQIDDLYDKLIALAQQQPTEDGALPDEEVERCYDRLLELQTVEAERFREQFEASLAMPIDAGAQVLARIRALKEELEDLASSDAAT
jgi:RNA polymerase sigma factor (sigma-70 family)